MIKCIDAHQQYDFLITRAKSIICVYKIHILGYSDRIMKPGVETLHLSNNFKSCFSSAWYRR